MGAADRVNVSSTRAIGPTYWRSREGESGMTATSTRVVIEALHRGLLGREPDAVGLAFWTQVADSMGIGEVVTSFVSSEEALDASVARSRVRDPRHPWSFSQHAEVERFLHLVCSSALPNLFAVDVGAADVRISNTVDLVGTLGWQGVMIEANPVLADRLKAALAGCQVTVVNCAIGTYEGPAPLFLGINDHISSLLRQSTASWGEVRGSVEVEVRRLPKLLDEIGAPLDFALLSIDIEGLDFEVLNDLVDTSDYRPHWIIAEWGPEWEIASMRDPRFGDVAKEQYVMVARDSGNVFLRRRGAI